MLGLGHLAPTVHSARRDSPLTIGAALATMGVLILRGAAQQVERAAAEAIAAGVWLGDRAWMLHTTEALITMECERREGGFDAPLAGPATSAESTDGPR